MDLSKSDIAGSLAAGESVYLDKCHIGTRVTELQDVIVAGTVLDGDGGVIHGNAVYGESCGLADVTYENGGAAIQASPIDFAAADTTLATFCGNVLNLPANGEVLIDGTEMQLSGTDPDVNVFDVAAEDLADGIWISIPVPYGATVVVRVIGIEAALRAIRIDSGVISAQTLLWSFCETGKLTIEGTKVPGSILAPNADVDVTDMMIDGTLVGGSVSGDLRTQSVPFKGCIDDRTGGPRQPS